MKPTITNAFNDGSADSAGEFRRSENSRGLGAFGDRTNPAPSDGQPARRQSRRGFSASLATMEVDLRDVSFGWSLELSPIHAIDVLHALRLPEGDAIQCLISMEQSTWRDGDDSTPIRAVAQRLAIPIISEFSGEWLAIDLTALQQLVSMCRPSRLVVIAVEGAIDERDAQAINRAIESGQSPLLAELRAVAALEVLGDRSLVMHCRDQSLALGLVAENFRHYLAACTGRSHSSIQAPDAWHVERLLSLTGSLTIRPIETQKFSTSIDVGVGTSRDRAAKPADRSLIYDIPSDTWHDEP